MKTSDVYRLTKENYELKIKLLEMELQEKLRSIRLSQKVAQTSSDSLDESHADDDENDYNDTTTGISAESMGLDYEEARKLIQTLDSQKEYSGLWIINKLIGRIPKTASEKRVGTNFLKRLSSLELAPPRRGGKPGKRECEYDGEVSYFYKLVMPSITNMDDE